MGFGFNLFLIFVLLPLLALAVILALIFPKSVAAYKESLLSCLTVGVSGIVLLVLFSAIFNYLAKPMKLDADDYYGEYVIDKSIFPGKNSEWQYNHFRLEIKYNGDVLLHTLGGNKKMKVYKGNFYIDDNKPSATIRFEMSKPTSHVMIYQPKVYRSAWGFTLVMKSTKYHHMYFKKKSFRDW